MLHLFLQAGIAWSATCGTAMPTRPSTEPSTAEASCRLTAARPQAAQSVTGRALGEAVPQGPPTGFWNYPTTFCNTEGVTAAVTGLTPPKAINLLERASDCGMFLFLTPARRLITTTGTAHAPFSLENAAAFDTQLAAKLTADVVDRYRGKFAVILGDDYGCADCWGGVPVTPAQVEAWAIDFRQKIPDVPLCVRVETGWVLKSPTLRDHIDCAWAQYHEGKGDASTYFGREAATAERLGLALAGGVNLTNCRGRHTSTCTPAEFLDFMTSALKVGNLCAAMAWSYDDATMADPDMREAWRRIVRLAEALPAVPCRHA
jgi:hypothetical protein